MRNLSKFPMGIFVFFLAVYILAFTQESSAQHRTVEAHGDLVWSDEFEGSGAPDASKWERQEYNRRNNDNGPDGWWSKDDSYLDGKGNLVIRVREIDNKNDDTDSFDYSVGALRTKGRFYKKYGRFEIRCQLPTQPGWWVAFWMMQGNVASVGNGAVDGVEVDIMEGFGWTDVINYAFHWDGYGDEHKSLGKKVTPAGIREGFHTFAMEWYPEMYVFYIDGQETWRSEGGGICDQQGYIKVTGEISTQDWAINNWWANDPADATYPDSFLVDYVRVYEVGDYQYPESTQAVTRAVTHKLYPNPVKNQLMVEWDQKLYEELPTINIINIAGQCTKTFHDVPNQSNISVEGLSGGIYCLSIQHGEALEYWKFIKE